MNKENIQQELAFIIQKITSNTPIEAVFLFGSWAYGEPRADSDIDIYLVIPDSDIDLIELNANIRYALYKKLSLPLDLVIAKKAYLNTGAEVSLLKASL